MCYKCVYKYSITLLQEQYLHCCKSSIYIVTSTYYYLWCFGGSVFSIRLFKKDVLFGIYITLYQRK